MKRFVFTVLLLLLCYSGLVAEETLYQKSYNNFDNITAIALVEKEKDWYFISIITTQKDTSVVYKYNIYDSDKNRIQDLLFLFEKEKDYLNRIESMDKSETLSFLKEETDIKENLLLKTKHYLYTK